MSPAAQVTVVDIDGEDVEIVICGATDADMKNLTKALEDGVFRGTILDGAVLDAASVDSVDCANFTTEAYSSTSNDLSSTSNFSSSSAYQEESTSSSSHLLIFFPFFAFCVIACSL